MRIPVRIRHSVAAVACALTVAFAFPGSAHAAVGTFTYAYVGLDGGRQEAVLTDPPNGRCITLPEVSDPDSSEPAFAPRNFTDAPAVVFTGTDCDGDSFTLRPAGGHASDRLKLRSVLFL